MFHYLRATYTRYLHSHFCYDMPSASSAAAAAAIAINRTWLIPQIRTELSERPLPDKPTAGERRVTVERIKQAREALL